MNEKRLMLEFFSGSKVMANTFKSHGWDTVTVDINPDYKPDICKNVYDLLDDESVKSICKGKIPNVIWSSPDCTTYSIASISTHRYREWNGFLHGKTEYAIFCDNGNKKLVSYLKSLKNTLWFIENPRGGLRKTEFMQNLPRYTVTYCQYGDIRQKPTDIWTNHPNPNFKPMCHNGDSCHVSAPRGSKTGTQGLKGSFERSKIPKELCEYIYSISESYFNGD